MDRVDKCDVTIQFSREGRVTYWWATCRKHGIIGNPVHTRAAAYRFGWHHVSDVTQATVLPSDGNTD